MTHRHTPFLRAWALAVPLALRSLGAWSAKPGVAKAPAATALSQKDLTQLLHSCGGQALRNAKLYAARVKGVQIMRQSAERNQARSSISLEEQMSLALDALRSKPSLKAEADRMEDVLVVMTELTVQAPLADQVSTALRMAETAVQSCAKLRAGGGYVSDATSGYLTTMLEDSQRVVGFALEAALRPGAVTPNLKPMQDATMRFENALAAWKKDAAADAGVAIKLVDDQWFFVRIGLAKAGKGEQAAIEQIARASELLFEELLVALRARNT